MSSRADSLLLQHDDVTKRTEVPHLFTGASDPRMKSAMSETTYSHVNTLFGTIMIVYYRRFTSIKCLVHSDQRSKSRPNSGPNSVISHDGAVSASYQSNCCMQLYTMNHNTYKSCHLVVQIIVVNSISGLSRIWISS